MNLHPSYLRILAGLAVAVLVVGCRPKNEFVPPPPPEVIVAKPHREDVVDSIDFTGTTRAAATVELRARVGGYLEKIDFTDGMTVPEKKLLFVIEKAPYEAALQAAKAEVQKAEASLLLADATLARTRQLVESNAASKQQLDVDEAQRATSAAAVAAAQAAVKQAQLNLDYTEIRAPVAGRIGRRLIDVGNLVHAETSLLGVIETVSPIYVYFYVSESDLLRFMEMLREHKLPDPSVKPPTLYVGLMNEQGYPHEGTLDFREFGVDPGTGTILRRVTLKNLDEKLIPGLFVRLRATLGEPRPALLVDRRAIGSDQRGDYLLVVNEKNVVEYRTVKLGVTLGEMQVVESGISADDWIVINGLQRARPGATVNPQRRDMPATSIDDMERLTSPKSTGTPQPGMPQPTGTPQPAGTPRPTGTRPEPPATPVGRAA